MNILFMIHNILYCSGEAAVVCKLPSPGEEVHHQIGIAGVGGHVDHRPAVARRQLYVGAVADECARQADLTAGLTHPLQRSHAVTAVLINVDLVTV